MDPPTTLMTTKRKSDLDVNGPENSKKKSVNSFFTNSKPKGNFMWLPKLGPSKTCLHGINLVPETRTKVAAFDFDGTIIAGNGSNDLKLTWSWWNVKVPAKLVEAHAAGYSVVIISNQNLKTDKLDLWKRKVAKVAEALPDLPFRILASTTRDQFRKPIPGMWWELQRIFRESEVEIDISQSFFVGDAAGRSGDWTDTDRKWALNLGIPFSTPEEYILGRAAQAFKLSGFDATSISDDLPLYTPTSRPLFPQHPLHHELIVLCGLPAIGKTTFFETHLAPQGYQRVCAVTLGNHKKVSAAAKEILQAGQPCVIDGTHAEPFQRKRYASLAKELDVPVRCFWFQATLPLAWHNNVYSAFYAPPESRKALVPFAEFLEVAISEPLNEGFDEVKRLNWQFSGTKEERSLWSSLWLQVK